MVPKLLADIKHGRQFVKHRSSCNVLRSMGRVFMGKISTFCPVNWNNLKNSYHYEIMQTTVDNIYFTTRCLQISRRVRGIHAARAKCTVSTVFSSFTILYYTPMYYEVNLNNGTTYR